MIIEEIMKTKVLSLKPENTIEDAIALMANNKIRHLPIINDEQQLIGLVTDRDIKDATPSIFYVGEHRDELQKPLENIMKTDIITGHPLDFVEEAAALFHEHHIGCMPILKGNRLVGIITETDLLHTLVELTGADKPGSQIEVKVPNISGVLSEITNVIKAHKANILSILVYPDKRDDAYKILVIRLQTMNPVSVINDLKKAGHQVLWPNLPGIQA